MYACGFGERHDQRAVLQQFEGDPFQSKTADLRWDNCDLIFFSFTI